MPARLPALLAVATLLACASDDGAQEGAPTEVECGAAGIPTLYEGAWYCGYASADVAADFACPGSHPHAFTAEGFVVCSADPSLDTGTLAAIGGQLQAAAPDEPGPLGPQCTPVDPPASGAEVGDWVARTLKDDWGKYDAVAALDDGMGGWLVAGVVSGEGVVLGQSREGVSVAVDKGKHVGQAAWVARYDPAGRPRSAQVLASGGLEICAAHPSPSGGVYLVGHFGEQTVFGDPAGAHETLLVPGRSLFVASYDAQGVFERVETIAGLGGFEFTGCETDLYPDGSIAVVGRALTPGAERHELSPPHASVFARVGALGVLGKVQQIAAYVMSIAAEPDGGMTLAGLFDEPLLIETTAGTQTLAPVGVRDGFVARFDQNRVPMWLRRFGGKATAGQTYKWAEHGDRALEVVRDASGDLYVAGRVFGVASWEGPELSASEALPEPAGEGSSPLLMRVSPAGGLRWAWRGEGAWIAGVYALDLDPEGAPIAIVKAVDTVRLPGVDATWGEKFADTMLLTRFTPEGALVYAHVVGTGEWQVLWPEGMVVGPDGGVAVRGHFAEDIELGLVDPQLRAGPNFGADWLMQVNSGNYLCAPAEP